MRGLQDLQVSCLSLLDDLVVFNASLVLSLDAVVDLSNKKRKMNRFGGQGSLNDEVQT